MCLDVGKASRDKGIPALLWNPSKEGKQLAEERRESGGHYCKADPELTLFTARLKVKMIGS